MSIFDAPDRATIREHDSACYVEGFPHGLPHRNTPEVRKCGHAACDPHTLTYFGTGDDPDMEGDYCMVCYGQTFGIWPDKTLQAAMTQA